MFPVCSRVAYQAVTGASALGSTAALRAKKYRPKYERFDLSQTRITLKAAFQRPLLDLNAILEAETLQYNTLFVDPSAPPKELPIHPSKRRDAIEERKALEAKKASKLAETMSKEPKPDGKAHTAAHSSSASSSAAGLDPHSNAAGLTVSEGGGVGATSGASSPRDRRASSAPAAEAHGSAPPPEHPPRGKTADQKASKNEAYDREKAIEKLLKTTPYTRMVFMFKYDNEEMLEAINFAVNAVNQRALPNIQVHTQTFGSHSEYN
jgi:hypothetical protein